MAASPTLYFAPPLSQGAEQVSTEQPALYGVLHGRPMFGSVDIHLNEQNVVADYGSLLWMQDSLVMTTGLYGDCCSAIGRNCSGESMCMNTYTGTGMVGFAFTLPGDIISLLVKKDIGWITSQKAFICGSTNIRISGRFAGCCASQLSGEGMFLTKVTLEKDQDGPGIFYAGGYGGINRHDVPSGQTLLVDNGLFFAAGHKQKLRIGWTGGGLKAACFSGEGLVMRLNGPSTIYTQNRDPSIFKPPEDPTSGDGDPFTT